VQEAEMQHDQATHHRTQTIDGLEIFYREAGSAENPAIVLLHGFPTSSHMFRDLIPRLADRYHVIAPDYPGFGYSSTPSPTELAYTFDHLADIIEKLLEVKQLASYALYMQDFGGPVGFRIATRRPERVRALIIQNANAYEEGLSKLMREVVVAAYKELTPEREAQLLTFFERSSTEKQYLIGEPDPTLVSPDAIAHAQWGLERPGNQAIQLALHVNYGSNVERYPQWHAFLREHQPRTLIVWGQGDRVFLPAGAEAYRRDLREVELHMLDAGHFALESQTAYIAERIRMFV
jgi:pimeloyl-ACP methyl ester carboxylesterase